MKNLCLFGVTVLTLLTVLGGCGSETLEATGDLRIKEMSDQSLSVPVAENIENWLIVPSISADSLDILGEEGAFVRSLVWTQHDGKTTLMAYDGTTLDGRGMPLTPEGLFVEDGTIYFEIYGETYDGIYRLDEETRQWVIEIEGTMPEGRYFIMSYWDYVWDSSTEQIYERSPYAPIFYERYLEALSPVRCVRLNMDKLTYTVDGIELEWSSADINEVYLPLGNMLASMPPSRPNYDLEYYCPMGYAMGDALRIEGNFQRALPFREGVAAVMENGMWYYIDEMGEKICDVGFEGAYNLAEVQRNFGIAVQDGTFYDVEPSSVTVENYLAGYIPSYYYINGMPEIRAYSCSEGLIAVQKNGKWGYIDRAGNEIIACQYEATRPVNPDGLAWVKVDGLWGVADLSLYVEK